MMNQYHLIVIGFKNDRPFFIKNYVKIELKARFNKKLIPEI